ncbi:NAD-dependent epimerase/dehydratase family protein [Cohnella faecalis]|uniref:NAD-dependent epimerase/dehydratase family protein n=1 Tax=Cohnella faecalis TaxID=2315694 RepID=UPI003615E2A9
MKIIVTGAAGFIGSHLCERLLRDPSNEIVGIDCFLDSGTPPWIRERNIRDLLAHPRFAMHRSHLLQIDWDPILPGTDVVIHLAGVPGVRSSWGGDFTAYVTNNVLVTQSLLEACRKHPVRKFIYGSTSSVYGEKTGKVSEDAEVVPLSPYGVSKLSGEHLCRVYQLNDALPVAILRFFTVYGPRQRPDMAFHRFIRRILAREPIPVFGNGEQSRDFTFVEDCVAGIAAAAYADGILGETINIGGKERASVLQCVSLLEEAFGSPAHIEFAGPVSGEPHSTWADISKARRLLGYDPKVSLREGLRREIADLRDLYTGLL